MLKSGNAASCSVCHPERSEGPYHVRCLIYCKLFGSDKVLRCAQDDSSTYVFLDSYCQQRLHQRILGHFHFEAVVVVRLGAA